MQGAFGARWAGIALAWVGLAALAAPARAIEFWDERIQIHGFYETRMSFGYEDFNSGNEIDMYGWLQVLSIEAEAEIAPDGWGPFDMVAAFARVEVKYDCVWSHACGTLQSVDAFGNNPKNLPHRVQTGNRSGLAGSQRTHNDRRPFWFDDRRRLDGGRFADTKAGQRAAKSFVYGSTNVGLFGASAGPDGILGDFGDIRNEQGPGAFAYGIGFTDPTSVDPITGVQHPGNDDAGTYLFNRFADCQVGNFTSKSANRTGTSSRELLWGIDSCDKIIDSIGLHREIANPFADEANSAFGGDLNPVLLALNMDPTDPGFGLPLDPNGNGIPNASALPFRPGSEFAALPRNKLNRAGGQENWHSQGIFVPNLAVRKALRTGDFDNPDQNFRLDELQWNRGASQGTLKELREIYMEFEAFESQLWVRAGKQTIVWGKTELFRNQDQWNPVDIAIGPLSSLEESRIALWSLRGIWSFYEVGPLEDVRLELVALLDEYEPTDIGRCGEPFVPRLACTKSYGLWVHGVTATGIAGEYRPADPWASTSGTEVGARVEFRWDRFSFALTDYYGYADFPFVDLLFQYSRNVDPISGRPRHTQATGRCTTDPLAAQLAGETCLKPSNGSDTSDPIDDGIIANHSINQQLFAWICAGTVGVAPSVDAAACAFTLFNSTNPLSPPNITTPFARAFGQMIAGVGEGRNFYPALVGDVGVNKIAPALNNAFGNPATSPGATGTLYASNQPLVGLFPGSAATGLPILPAPMQALYGCGAFFGTVCDVAGVDLANAEASVLLQSFPWFEGTLFNSNWNTADASLPQPGTVDAIFNDGPGGGVDAPFSKPGEIETGAAGTRYEDDNGVDNDGDGNVKDLFILPGARLDPLAMAGSIAAADLNGIEIPRWVQASLAQYDISEDWTTLTDSPGFGSGAGGCAPPAPANCILATHPFTGQLWSSAGAIASWNLLMLVTGLGAADNAPSRGTLDREQPLALGRCSYRQPQFCSFVSGLAAQARNTHSSVRAGGNGRFGRRNFVWASIGDLALQYQKRNILGFSMDFAEDTTKSSWGVEFTHVNDSIAADNGDYSGLTKLDEYNLTVSVDRPTFINFLNANRTFFINSQLFASYLQGYNEQVLRDGPLTALLLVNANTGYFQDRFLVSMAGVYDFTSQSAAFLPSVQYRFTENFSMTIGAAVLAGGWSRREMGINQFSAQSDANLSDSVYGENGISPARDLDNFVLRLRYTY